AGVGGPQVVGEGLQEAAFLVVDAQQGLDPRPQGPVVPARPLDVQAPVFRRFDPAGEGKDGLFLELWHGRGTPLPRARSVPYPIVRKALPDSPISGEVPAGSQGGASVPGPSISRRSQQRAYAQSFSAVDVAIPRAWAASSIVNPAKKRSLTSSALRRSWVSSLSRASFRARRSRAGPVTAGCVSGRSRCRRSRPALRLRLWRARSTRMRRMASAAAAKKWPRLFQF